MADYHSKFKIQNSKITIIFPRRGINDEGKGKKHALYRLISAAETEYVWMQDDDIVLHSLEDALTGYSLKAPQNAIGIFGDPAKFKSEDLLILPLRMESESEHPSLLEQVIHHHPSSIHSPFPQQR